MIRQTLKSILAVLVTLVALPINAQELGSTITKKITFKSLNEWIFDAKIIAPPKDSQNGYGVLLIGGGIGNDLDWTTPGKIEINGREQRISITGKPHSDATRIAASLVNKGFIVMHWSTISRNDPKRDGWPNQVTYHPPKKLLQFAEDALKAFRSARLFDPDRTVLMGYSLGGVRSANLAQKDKNIAALVLLASAQFCRTGPNDPGRNIHRKRVQEIFSKYDADKNGTLDTKEYQSFTDSDRSSELNSALTSYDVTKDDSLNFWELAAAFANIARDNSDQSLWKKHDRYDLAWTEDLIQTNRIPTLLVYGENDNAQSHHYALAGKLVSRKNLEHVDTKLIKDVGHQLGAEKDGRPGPIAGEVTTFVADWLDIRLVKRPTPR